MTRLTPYELLQLACWAILRGFLYLGVLFAWLIGSEIFGETGEEA